MKWVVAMCLFALSAATASSAYAAYGARYAASEVHNALIGADETMFAFVDVQEVLTRCYAGREAKAKLDGDALKAEMEKNSRERALKEMKADLEKQIVQLSETEKSARQKEYEIRLQEYQQFVTKTAEAIRVENAELTRSVVGEIISVVQDYGRKKRFLGIFFKSEGMLYLDDKVDITGAILEAMNATKISGL